MNALVAEAMQGWPLILVAIALTGQLVVRVIEAMKGWKTGTDPIAHHDALTQAHQDIVRLANSIHELALAVQRLDGSQGVLQRSIDGTGKQLEDIHDHLNRMELHLVTGSAVAK